MSDTKDAERAVEMFRTDFARVKSEVLKVIVGVALGMTSALVVQWCWWKYQPSTFADMR